MRKALIALAAAATLTACGGGEEPAAGDTLSATSSSSATRSLSPAPSSSAAVPTLAPTAKEQAFVTFLEGRGFIPTYATADVAVVLANALCSRFDQGFSYEDVLAVLLDGGIPVADAGAFEGVAVSAFCPEHTGKRTGEPGGA